MLGVNKEQGCKRLMTDFAAIGDKDRIYIYYSFNPYHN